MNHEINLENELIILIDYTDKSIWFVSNNEISLKVQNLIDEFILYIGFQQSFEDKIFEKNQQYLNGKYKNYVREKQLLEEINNNNIDKKDVKLKKRKI